MKPILGTIAVAAAAGLLTTLTIVSLKPEPAPAQAEELTGPMIARLRDNSGRLPGRYAIAGQILLDTTDGRTWLLTSNQWTALNPAANPTTNQHNTTPL